MPREWARPFDEMCHVGLLMLKAVWEKQQSSTEVRVADSRNCAETLQAGVWLLTCGSTHVGNFRRKPFLDIGGAANSRHGGSVVSTIIALVTIYVLDPVSRVHV